MDLELEPVDRAPTYEVVISRLKNEILSGRLRAGDRLPGERALSEQLGVSRASVREAVRALQAFEIVQARPGNSPTSGLTMTARPRIALSNLFRLHVGLASYSVEEVMAVRVGLETQAMLTLAEKTDLDLAGLHALLDRMSDPEITPETAQDLDAEFHLSLASQTNNHLIADMMQALRDAIAAPMLASFKAQPDWPSFCATIVEEHRSILRALEARDGRLAAQLTRDHVEGFYPAVTDSQEPDSTR
ncbi:FadR family transcriptional regulator [Spiractinospora alimapuensis]|uniref:FadR/GntR family transcriptional regulator n=1 Tax=Spiractinospora alimapuensis TaxID=2820884 RepID=UPI001F336536|nr:FadR/GntR family transcriptional regulator [Spiractinospora alimapuensis]QVQ53822.1 FadR family transcriptional regulator [Spiractinospora alimapuensis]